MTRILAVLAVTLTGALPLRASEITVFAAASLKSALDEIATLYEAQTGTQVTRSFAGSSVLARQIAFGAPADLFISADGEWMDVLERDGQIRPESRVDLLSNRMVLIARADDPIALDLVPGADLAGALGSGWMAMALVDAVPAGRYGKAALMTLGLWTTVVDRVAQADNVRAALRLVSTGQAKLGIVYASDVRADPNVRVVDTFPIDSHPPVRYPAALTIDARPDAASFLTHLQGPAAQAVFRRWGFGAVPP